MSLSVNLIIDRTQQDVESKNIKGTYTHEDLNRVGVAVNEIAALLSERGYHSGAIGKTDWQHIDIPRESDMEMYLVQLRKIKDAFSVKQTTPHVPESMHNFNYIKANDIEELLLDIYTLISQIDDYYLMSNDFYSGDY